MMKYAINHPKKFSTPYVAATLGLIYVMVEMLITIGCIIKMDQQTTILNVLNSYIAYGALAFVP